MSNSKCNKHFGNEAHSYRSKKEKKMNTTKESSFGTINKDTKMKDRKMVLSTLWIYLSVNYIYCDHLENMQPGTIKELLAGQIGTIQVTPEFLLVAAVMLQIPFMMIVLSRVLKYGANRWANIIAGILMTVIQIGTMGMGTVSSPSYLFYSAIEIACNLFIVWYAWTWRNPEGQPSSQPVRVN
jgi:hypothetical protein